MPSHGPVMKSLAPLRTSTVEFKNKDWTTVGVREISSSAGSSPVEDVSLRSIPYLYCHTPVAEKPAPLLLESPPPSSPSSLSPPSSEADGQTNDVVVVPNNDHLVTSTDPLHPANLISKLCAHFYTLGWVTGTGGGMSVRQDGLIYLAPTGVQKEIIRPEDIFVLPEEHWHIHDPQTGNRRSHHDLPYIRLPPLLRPSACTPLFLTSFRLRGAGACIHTHSQWCVLVTLLAERSQSPGVFEIEEIEQIKGIPKGPWKRGNLGYYDRLRVPIIDNTALEENLTDSLEKAMMQWPDTYAVLVRRHGIYVWGDDVAKAKTTCESLDYIFQLAVEMHRLGVPWTKS